MRIMFWAGVCAAPCFCVFSLAPMAQLVSAAASRRWPVTGWSSLPVSGCAMPASKPRSAFTPESGSHAGRVSQGNGCRRVHAYRVTRNKRCTPESTRKRCIPCLHPKTRGNLGMVPVSLTMTGNGPGMCALHGSFVPSSGPCPAGRYNRATHESGSGSGGGFDGGLRQFRDRTRNPAFHARHCAINSLIV